MTISSRVATLGHSPAGRLARGEILEQGRVLGARFPILRAFTHGYQCDPDNGDSSHRDGNEATDRLAAAINASGHSYVTPSTVAGTRFIRVSIGQTHTEERHVDRLWKLIDETA